MPRTSMAARNDQWHQVKLEALSRIDTLPSLSTVISEFLELANQDYFTAKDFERVIVKDQALVARLLKVANSCSFSRSQDIHTIPEAVVLVGLNNIKNMVYAVSTGRLMLRNLQSYQYPNQGFWMHAMGVGMACRDITEATGKADLNIEEAFVAGLLHDVAKLIIDDFLDPTAGQRAVQPDEEFEVCGFDHAQLAGLIMERWKIPESIALAVRHHHRPKENGLWRLGAAAVSLADFICNRWGVGSQSRPDFDQEIREDECQEILDALAIPMDKLNAILGQLRRDLTKLEDYYDEG